MSKLLKILECVCVEPKCEAETWTERPLAAARDHGLYVRLELRQRAFQGLFSQMKVSLEEKHLMMVSVGVRRAPCGAFQLSVWSRDRTWLVTLYRSLCFPPRGNRWQNNMIAALYELHFTKKETRYLKISSIYFYSNSGDVPQFNPQFKFARMWLWFSTRCTDIFTLI